MNVSHIIIDDFGTSSLSGYLAQYRLDHGRALTLHKHITIETDICHKPSLDQDLDRLRRLGVIPTHCTILITARYWCYR